MQPLTDRQRQVYDYLLAYVLEHHDQPTYREIAQAMGMAGPSGVVSNICALVTKGWLRQRGPATGGQTFAVGRWSFAGVTLTASGVPSQEG